MKLALTIALLLCTWLPLHAHDSPAPRPHIVLFLADDLGWRDVGYHRSVIKTPNIDGLAKAGVRLERFYVQPVCSPTRSSLMTGRYPIRQGLQVGVIRPWARYGLPLEERTLAQGLRDAGYTTAIVGKWHLGLHDPAFLPRQRGFDHQYGHYTGAIDYFTHRRMRGLDWHRDGKVLEEEGYTTDLIGQEAVRLIEAHDPKKPLFLYVPFNAPHTPLQAPQKYIDRYAHIRKVKRRKFAAMVTCMDDAIGRITTALDKRGMRSTTLIFFASDNGGPNQSGANNRPLRGRKGTLFEGGVRVPALAVWPGKLAAGRVEKGLMHVVDLYPTLLGLAGASLQPKPPLDGKNMWPVLAEGKPSPRTEILHNLTPRQSAIRVGDWKLVCRNRRKTVELFNVVEDPSETTDRSADEPEKLKALLARLADHRQQAKPARGGRRKRPADWKAPAVWGEGPP